MQPVKVSCVSYLNSLPFVYGLRHHVVSEKIVLSLDNPAECAFKLREGLVDIGLIPVAAIQSVPNSVPITNWCIGANGPVKSVTLLSNVPLTEIESIILDYQSVTSNLLTRILADHYWKIAPRFLLSRQGDESSISGNTAVVIIGDRSLKIQNRFPFIYDLSGEWKNFTGLPFVFARWVSNKNQDEQFLNEFDHALAYGIDHIDDVIKALQLEQDYQPGSKEYLKNNLSYNFDNKKQQGMSLFLDYAKKITLQGITEPQ